MTNKELFEIGLHAAQGTAPANYSSSQVNSAFLDGLREMASDWAMFMKNRYDIYALVGKIIDEVVPKRVSEGLGAIADIQVVKQGEKPVFRVKAGKMRAKRFLTTAALSGVYETFRLDENDVEVPVKAIGIGATIDFERLLDGVETISDCVDVMTEALTDGAFLEVQKALKAALNSSNTPAANKFSGAFDSAEMVKLMSVVRAYGRGCVIFAPPEFIAEMGPDALVAPTANVAGTYYAGDLEAIHRTGYIEFFRGAPIVQIPQSFVDENNETTWIDPQMAYILPVGNEKVVKLVLEGPTIMNDFKNRDNSMEIHAYKKMGVAIVCHYNWATYQNTGITQTVIG